MRSEIAAHLPALRELCVKHRIRELYIFGSAVDDNSFDPARSDVDLLVEFLDKDLGPWLTKYFAFRDDCVALFGRPVDVMMTSAPNKPRIRAAIDATKVPVYAAA
jgi:predicted nucleotidyltransferase